jgi:myosin-5
MISDSVKKELNPLLELCIQVLLPEKWILVQTFCPHWTMSKHNTCQDPRTSHSSIAKGNLNGMGQQNQLTSYLDVLRANHVSAKLLLTCPLWHPSVKSSECTCLTLSNLQVPSILVHKLFTQIFSLIDVQLFNR